MRTEKYLVHLSDTPHDVAGGICSYTISMITSSPSNVKHVWWGPGFKHEIIKINDIEVPCFVLRPLRKRFKCIPEFFRSVYYSFRKKSKILKDADAIVFHDMHSLIPFLFGKKSIPYTWIPHGTNVPATRKSLGKRYLLLKAIEYFIFLRFDKVICESMEGKDYYSKRFPKQAHKIKFITNFVDPKLFYKMPKDECRKMLGMNHTYIFCYTGRLAPQKRVDLVIKVFAKLTSILDDCCLYIVGEGPRKIELVELTNNLKLENRVKFIGAVLHEKVRNYLCAADMVFLLSWWEGRATNMLETLMCGTPVIVSNVADNKTLIEGNKAGCVLENDDPEACASQIYKHLGSIEESSRNALLLAEQFDSRRVVPILIEEIMGYR